MLQIQSKRFYLDVKQNKRGKFIKVTKNVNFHWISHFVRRLPRSALMAGEPRSSWLSPLQVGNDHQNISKSWQCEQKYQKFLFTAEFRDQLSAFSDFYSSLGPPNPGLNTN